MKKEQILQMVQDAGFVNFAIPPEFAAVFYRFADLVRNAALEEAAQKCDQIGNTDEYCTAMTMVNAIRNLKEPTPFTAKELLLMNEQHIHAAQQTKAPKEPTP